MIQTQTTQLNFTQDQMTAIVNEAKTAAHKAAVDFQNKHGESGACGFAWTNIHRVKGNSKLGKMLKQAGVDQDYTRAFSIWNPSGNITQSVDIKEAGAEAAAAVFRKHGFEAYAGSRLD